GVQGTRGLGCQKIPAGHQRCGHSTELIVADRMVVTIMSALPETTSISPRLPVGGQASATM
ncbi:MAG TPA: hypothetical protein VLT92_04440, partial [Burkholderiales bacterium]|nr:hypothetical protein [Burkholderiales bacterium]